MEHIELILPFEQYKLSGFEIDSVPLSRPLVLVASTA